MNSKYNYSKEEVQDALNKSNSISEVLRYLGYKYVSCNHHRKYLNKFIEDHNLDLTQYKKNQKIRNPFSHIRKKAYTLSDIIKIKRRLSSVILTRILKEEGKDYICEECNCNGIYNGKPLTLQVDHIDGDPTNHKLKNMRFLCPNCHTQTHTYGSKNAKNKSRLYAEPIKYKCRCGVEIEKNSKTCNKCREKRTVIDWPNKDELMRLVWSKPCSILANELGVSDKAIEKRCKKYGISKPPRGYWKKHKSN